MKAIDMLVPRKPDRKAGSKPRHRPPPCWKASWPWRVALGSHTDVDRMAEVTKDSIFQKTLRYPGAMRNRGLGVVHRLDSLQHELSWEARQGKTQDLRTEACDSDSITAIDAPHKASPPAHATMGLVPKTL